MKEEGTQRFLPLFVGAFTPVGVCLRGAGGIAGPARSVPRRSGPDDPGWGKGFGACESSLLLL